MHYEIKVALDRSTGTKILMVEFMFAGDAGIRQAKSLVSEENLLKACAAIGPDAPEREAGRARAFVKCVQDLPDRSADLATPESSEQLHVNFRELFKFDEEDGEAELAEYERRHEEQKDSALRNRLLEHGAPKTKAQAAEYVALAKKKLEKMRESGAPPEHIKRVEQLISIMELMASVLPDSSDATAA